MVIGLTGGIATGKSSVASLLVSKGAQVIDVDQIAREAMLPGTVLFDAVIQHFGQTVRNDDGTLHRKKLGNIIFQDEKKRQLLEHLIHPVIRETMIKQIKWYEQKHPNTLIVVDIPLLYEGQYMSLFQEVMVVYAPVHIQLERLMHRDGFSEQEAQWRIDAQLNIEYKKKQAPIVIDNSGSWSKTEKQVTTFCKQKGLL